MNEQLNKRMSKQVSSGLMRPCPDCFANINQLLYRKDAFVVFHLMPFKFFLIGA